MFLVALLYIILVLPVLNAQSTNAKFSARLLDSVLQDYAFRAFVRPRTGIPYDGNVPSNSTGIKVTALRLRSGSMRVSKKPILVNVSNVKPVSMGLSPKCVYFNLDCAVEFDNLLNGNVCKTTKQGHFSIVIEFITAEPEPASGGVSGSGTDDHKSGKKKWVIFGSVVGGFVALVSLVLLITCLKKYDKQKKIDRMEEAADRDVPLQMTRIGCTKAPVASQTLLEILAYDSYDLYVNNVPKLDILALEDPVTIRFFYVQPAPQGSLTKCIYFYSNNWSNLAIIQGHFSIVDEVKVAPSPSPAAYEIAPSPSPTVDENNHQNIYSKMWIISGIFIVLVRKFGFLEIRQRLDDSAVIVEPLLGNTEVPLPVEAPIRPLLENDYVLQVTQKL
ncbi:hypothetical protein K7X08_000805 [Anisodus acutangulus]|uniref:Transmembrane protein n=1 Tax=Anisodus acutangulus TaxID=402998 RepID=A0A9Q1RIG4_9SOLA|nr:hypothetical protein K7X08_000805 [Anisodus acutangulus]